MEDVLDFSADFWEKRLDYEPQDVDNIYSKGGLSYAIDDYCGFDPVSEWLQTPSEKERLPAVRTPKGRNKGRTKAKGDKHLSSANK